MDGFASQLALLARGRSGRVVRSKRGFGLPGDCSEMSLPPLRKECMYTNLEVLSPVFHGYEAGPFMLRDKHRVKAFENGELGRHLGSKRTK